MEFFGIKIDRDLNKDTVGDAGIISTPDSKVTVVVYPTDEEFVIAQDTFRIVNK